MELKTQNKEDMKEKLNEKDIIELIKKEIEEIKLEIFWDYQHDNPSIAEHFENRLIFFENILKLYNNLKEEINWLNIENDWLNKEYDSLFDIINDFDKNHIDVTIIKDKINEYDRIIEEYQEKIGQDAFSTEYYDTHIKFIQFKKKGLEDLLEEKYKNE